MFLYNEASRFHCTELGNGWFRQGCRLLLNGTRWTVLLFSGIQTLFVSQLAETTVPAGALAARF